MPLKTPKFWHSDNFLARALLPLSWLYGYGYRLKQQFQKPYTSTLPVLCVGGVVAGGSGKTPVLQALLKLIMEHKIYERPVILTRGYGGILRGLVVVDPSVHTAKDVGDEAMIHAQYANVIVAKNRADGAMLAEMMGADILLMDDGLQNTSLHKDISFLVINSHQSLGNGFLLPAGPLREPLQDALEKCEAVIETGGGHGFDNALKTSMSVISSHNKDISYFGFAGLGHPEKFKQTLIDNGFKLAGFKEFSDHHPYTESDIKKLLHLAGTHRLITTQKDAMRIPAQYQTMIDVLMIELSFDNPEKILEILAP